MCAFYSLCSSLPWRQDFTPKYLYCLGVVSLCTLGGWWSSLWWVSWITPARSRGSVSRDKASAAPDLSDGRVPIFGWPTLSLEETIYIRVLERSSFSNWQKFAAICPLSVEISFAKLRLLFSKFEYTANMSPNACWQIVTYKGLFKNSLKGIF